jgi:uncharacterized ferritin-like protein (DUF455 family)
MRGAVAKETMVVRGVTLRRDPAREPCFKIVHLHSEVPSSEGLGSEARRKRMHREYNQEVQTLEIAALCLADFPEAPWELRMELARQCWDEARHAVLYFRRFQELGGSKGDYAIANLDWSVVAMLDSLAARLAVQHRTFEAGSLDLEGQGIPMFREAGDDSTADIMDAVVADEIQHVRFANAWLKRLTDADPRAVLEVAAAITWLRGVVVATGGDPLKLVATSVESRELSGFSKADITEVARMERVVAAQIHDKSAKRRNE